MAVGDSLTEGLGVAEESAYPAILENKLQKDGYRYRVINAGISGETSSGTLSRIKWVLTLKPDIVILVIGANDGFRGIDPGLIESNIRRIIEALKADNVIVVLGGMQIVQNLGRTTHSAFAAVYPQVAESENVILIPIFPGRRGRRPCAQPVRRNSSDRRRIPQNCRPYLSICEAGDKQTAGKQTSSHIIGSRSLLLEI